MTNRLLWKEQEIGNVLFVLFPSNPKRILFWEESNKSCPACQRLRVTCLRVTVPCWLVVLWTGPEYAHALVCASRSHWDAIGNCCSHSWVSLPLAYEIPILPSADGRKRGDCSRGLHPSLTVWVCRAVTALCQRIRMFYDWQGLLREYSGVFLWLTPSTPFLCFFFFLYSAC